MPIEFSEPYPADPADRLTHGRLLHAAAHGDKRAKATLRATKRAAGDDEPAKPSNGGSVRAGRLLHEGRGTSQTEGEPA